MHADLCRSAIPGLKAAPGDFVAVDVVGRSAQVFAVFAFGKGAELAFEIADVGVIDVAIDNIANGIAVRFVPQTVGGLSHPG